jgi:N-acetyl-anhydromuramyl-L-alanine amidase AmpD
MANKIRLTLTPEGEDFIRHVCTTTNQNNRLLKGKASDNVGGNSPLNNTNPAVTPDYVWECKIKNPKNPSRYITTGAELADALILWFNELGNRHRVDPNIMAAQAYAESKYQIWSYSNAAMGISQFTLATIFTVLVNNFGKTLDSEDINNRNLITSGLTNPLNPESYKVSTDIGKTNKRIIHQNICNNPRVMLEAQFKYMRNIAERSENLASIALFGYSRGPAYALKTYSASIQKAMNAEKDDYYEEGTNYVLEIFTILGDKNNKILFKGIKLKPSGKYFGYDHLFNYTDSRGQEINQLLWKNTNFSVFDANIEESKLLGIENGFESNIVVNKLMQNPNYKIISYPENRYFRSPMVEKTQIVLHHTISGEDPTGNINHWYDWYQKSGEKVSVPFIINRRGSIYQLYLTTYWGQHLGVDKPYNGRALHERSIGIELSSWGGLTKKNGQWYNTRNNLIPQENVVEYPNGFHGFYAFEKYTEKQIKSLEDVLLAIKLGHPEINYTFNENMFGVYNTETKQYDLSVDALTGQNGIWSHTAYRLVKSDIHPQKEIIDMLKGLVTKVPTA